MWLSAISAPFGYATTVLLARVGPQVIGTYGLLTLYIGVVTTILYLGGDAVTIKFVPLLPRQSRVSFLLSYLFIIYLSLIPWLLVATCFPSGLHYLFGTQAPPRLQLLLIYLAPLPISSMMIIAAFKSVLAIAWAQVLARILTLGGFVIYASLYFNCRGLLMEHYMAVIWEVYFGLIAVTCVVGVLRLKRMEEWRRSSRGFSFALPRGFWKYTISLQQTSFVGFFAARLDMILVLNLAGLEPLGRYVAVLAVASLVQVANRLFTETLLPALTNLLAVDNVRAASEVFTHNLRILFVVSLSVACGSMFLIKPLTVLMGRQYAAERSLFVVMLFLYGLAGPGTIGGTLLTSVGKQQRSVWVGLGQVALSGGLSVPFWRWHGLPGLVFTIGGCLALSQVVLLIVAMYSAPLTFRFGRDYFCFFIVMSAALVLALSAPSLGTLGGLACWGVAVGVFLLLARYSFAEVLGVAGCFVFVDRAKSQ